MIIIDVREPEEYRSGHVEGAINIPPNELNIHNEKLTNINKDEEIVVYCISGARSHTSINVLAGMGFTNLINGINQAQVEAKYNL